MASDSYLELVKSLPEQLEAALKIEPTKLPSGSFNKILVTGMGGSSIVGSLLQAYLSESKLPVFVSRSYTLPSFVDRSTLVFAISYSGNTEETISSLRSAYARGASIVAVTSGGKLLKKFVEEKAPLIRLPPGLQPRASLAYQLVPILRVMAKLALISDPAGELGKAIATLRRASYNDQAKSLAGKLVGKVPLVYASERFSPVAYRWKTQFNENAKVHAFSNAFSELNHNEIMGFTSLHASYHVVILEDQADHPRIKARMQLMRKMLSRLNVPSTHIVVRGDNILTRLLSAMHIGDLASVYLAIFTNTDPEPVQLIEDLKRQLEKIPRV